MLVEMNNQTRYRVSKHYHKSVSEPPDYFVKTLGIDCEERRTVYKNRQYRNESYFRAPNEKFVGYMTVLICKYRHRVIKAELKQLRYEEAQETI